jgi:HD-GYP domain-containing protein (c-di-GMP phosphodiesterase class II)
MRYIPTGKLEPGMALGHDIYDGAGRLLLARHLLLTEEYISSLEFLGFPGIYIDDEFTRGIEIQRVISPQIRRQALKLVHDFFGFDTDKKELPLSEVKIRAMVERVVEEILCNGDIMCNMIDIKNYDDYIYYHSVNVGILSVMLGSRCGLEQEKLNLLATAAMLHDLGKRFLEPEVVMGEWPLTGETRELWKKHPQYGVDYLKKNCDFSMEVYSGILHHHEWYNGTGYPSGRAGEKIPVFARIIKLVDCYDSLVSGHPGREQYCPAEAVEYLMAGTGTEFDPKLVGIFSRKLSVYPQGCEVELSDGRHGIVAKNFEDFPLRPLVKILGTGEWLNLRDNLDARSLTVGKIILR